LLVVLDIPLLFETGGEVRVDAVVVISAPAFLQRQRVLARPAMTAERLDAILARQTPDKIKRRRADFVVHSGLGRAFSFRRLRVIMARTRGLQARHWPPSPYLVKKTER
jgi:dephospho-CoA kinase